MGLHSVGLHSGVFPRQLVNTATYTETHSMGPNYDKKGKGDGLPPDWSDDEIVVGPQFFQEDTMLTGDDAPTVIVNTPRVLSPGALGAQDTVEDYIPNLQDRDWKEVSVGLDDDPKHFRERSRDDGVGKSDRKDGRKSDRNEGNKSEREVLRFSQPFFGPPPVESDETTPPPPTVPNNITAPATPQASISPLPGEPRLSSRSGQFPRFAPSQASNYPSKYSGADPALASHQSFRREMGNLSRSRDFRSIAGLYETALATASWAVPDDMQVNLLLDLAKLYKDRINEPEHAQFTFERLIDRRPGHNEAMDFLRAAYEAQGNMRKLHDIYALAVDTEWSPERRLELTRAAARLALDELEDSTAAARDWEHLLELGDMDGQVTVELSQVYREAERWPDLGQFLEQRAVACAGTTRVAILREAIEAFLSGARSPDRAETLIAQLIKDNPDDPVALASLANVRAQQGNWVDLEEVALQPMTGAPLAAKLDVLRLTAGLLSSAGEHDRAATAYVKVLEAAPNDREAVSAREEHLRRTGDHDGLVTFLTARANKARNAEEKADLFERAARVADEALASPGVAASLFLQCVQAKPDRPRAYEALIGLYERLNDVEGITRALEGLASITQDPKARAKVLRRLGDHYAYCAKNDDQAQRCWLEVAAILPDDLSVQKELNGIHRRRGDFAALDEALTRQLWRTTDLDAALDLSREVAHNLDDNLNEPAKSNRAWLHVLGLAPDAEDALLVLSERLSSLDTTEVHAILETRLSSAIQRGDETDRIIVGLAIARLWEQRGDKTAALAAYERVRAWAPCDTRVVEPLVRLLASDSPSAAASVLEIAAAHADNPDSAKEVLARIIPLIGEDKPRQRYFLLHRLLRFDSSGGLGEAVEAAESAEAWKDLAALYERLAEANSSPEMRRAYRIQLTRVCEDGLADPQRAFIALHSLALTATSTDDRLALTRLAEATGRWEDLLAVLDATLRADTPTKDRQAILLQRADICEHRLRDHHRAFLEYQRLVQGRSSGELDEVEAQALEHMHRIAVEHGLVHELESVYSELWDRAPNDDVRVTVARSRLNIRRDHLKDPSGAVEQALLVLRLRPRDESVAREILEASETLGLWTRTLPVLEGVWRAQGDNPEKLRTLAQLYRDKCAQPSRAAELLAEALRMNPNDDATLGMLEALGEATGLWPRVVLAIRLAAAQAGASPRALQLVHRVAKLYAENLGDTDSCLDAHRWILQIWPDEVDSLETVIVAHRKAMQHVDLRFRLEQWVDRVLDPARHAERWLEIGRLCRDHLDDSAGALVAYSNVIDLEPSNDEAADAMRGLGNVSLPAGLRRKQVRLELRRASDRRRAELLETLARLEQETGETDAAIEALRELYSLDHGRDLAFEPLTALLREAQRWEALADLEEDAASRAEPDVAIVRLRAALRVAEDHLDQDDRKERLLRRVIKFTPHDTDAFTRLARLLREAGRFEELANELSERLKRHADKHDRQDRQAMRRELIRLKYSALGDVEGAERLLRDDSEKLAKPDPDDALWLAMMMTERGDHARYLEQRRRHMAKLPPRLGALVVCHLAEYCDEFINNKARVLALYREARSIDPENTLASDALRSLGRGAKNWRSTAALLPQSGEESLTNEQRAQHLFTLGRMHLAAEPAKALDWFERAVAVDPNLVDAWDALINLGLERHETEYAYAMADEAVRAYERTTQPGASKGTAVHAQRLARAADLAQMANRANEARSLSAAACAMDPSVPSAALLVADARFDAGATDVAGEMYAAIVDQLGQGLEPKQRAHALHRKARSMIETGDLDGAKTELRKALATIPLFPPALGSMAEVLRRQGHPVSAALHELKALLVTRDSAKRGLICRRLGELCDGDLKRPDEAGAWFELAVEAGVEDKLIMRRLLEHFRRTGRASQALVAIEELIQAATDPMELAELWAARGSILADSDLDAAEEALDTALSYDPTHPTALASLSKVLEGRGDYEQLANLLEARSETGTTQERAEILENLAEMSFNKLHDDARGEQFLYRLLELAPSANAIDMLLAIVRRNPDRQMEQLPLIARLMSARDTSNISLCDRIIEASQIIFQTGERHWTWALLSALAGAAPVDAWTKAALADLRREYERFDSLTLVNPRLANTLGALPEPEPLQVALADACAHVFVRSEVTNGSLVDSRTGPGKLFERVTEQLGVHGRLIRSLEGTPNTGVLSGDIRTVVIRTDLLTASPGELTYIFVRGLLLARPECLALASVPDEDRPRLVRAIAAAIDETGASVDDPAVASLATSFAEKLSKEEVLELREHFVDLPAAETVAASAFEEMERAAMRVAAVAAGDARTALRAVARLAPDARRPPSVARIEDFESYYHSVPFLSTLFAFFANEDFGRALSGPV